MKFNKLPTLFCVICGFLLLYCWSCKKGGDDPINELFLFSNFTVSDVTETTVTCNFTVSSVEGIQKAGVIYDLSTLLTQNPLTVSTTNVANENISVSIEGLTNNTFYYYKAFVVTVDGDSIISNLNSLRTNPRPLRISTRLIEVEFQEQTVQFNVTCTIQWAITSNQPWCIVDPENGDVNTTINVLIGENLTREDRSATITVTAGDQAEEVIIEQSFPETDDIEPEMVFVEGGRFTMGCIVDDCLDDEKPSHQVTVSHFHISKQEITQALWRTVMGDNLSYFKGDSLPVENVSWNEVQEFIGKLSRLTGKQYRLPTEAEWEFAARGGNKSMDYRFSGSNEADDVAWYWNNIPSQVMGVEGYGTQTVGLKLPNELGIFDMSGNVFEWCSDWYGEYDSSDQTDPAGPASGAYRVVRGGSWSNGKQGVGVSNRGFIMPNLRFNYLGFRLVWIPELTD